MGTPLAGRLMEVRLAQVDKELRIKVVDEIIDAFKLDWLAGFTLRLAAENPQQNPKIKVPARKYVTVIVNQKIPPGKYNQDLFHNPAKHAQVDD